MSRSKAGDVTAPVAAASSSRDGRSSSISITIGAIGPHLAISLAVAAAQSGRRICYGTLADLITSLEEAQQAGHLTHRMKTPGFPSLLVVDEIGYLPVAHRGDSLSFS